MESPAVGADDVAAWLRQEGFDVTKLTDATKPVVAKAIKKAVGKFVNAGTYDQLVLYFSGHGYWKNNAEIWLLSGAPNDPDEAVSWVETVELARDSGVPHVVIISDACRSIPQTVKAMRVRGSVVFPNRATNTRVQSKIDKLQASLTGASAYEVALSKTSKVKTSVFTYCLRNAYTKPDTNMILSVPVGAGIIEVVPNRRLEAFLKREVAAVLSSVTAVLEQQPVIDVMSDEPAYIGQVRRPPTRPRRRCPRRPSLEGQLMAPVLVTDVARAAVVAEIVPQAGLPIGRLRGMNRGAAAAVSRRFSTMRSTIEAPHAVTRFESWTGFTVSGADVKAAVAGRGRAT